MACECDVLWRWVICSFFVAMSLSSMAQDISEEEIQLQSSLILAHEKMLMQNEEEAETLYKGLVEDRLPEAAYFLAELYRSREDFVNAVRMYEKALSWDRDTVSWYYLSAASAYAEMKEYSKAASTMEKLVKMSPSSEHLWQLLIEYQMSSSLYDQALFSLDELEKWSGNSSSIQLRRATIYREQGKMDKVIQVFDGLLEDSPDDGLLLAVYGSVLSAEGRTEEATRVFRQLIDIEPNNPEALAFLTQTGEAVYDPSSMRLMVRSTELSAREKVQTLLPMIQEYSYTKDSALGTELRQLTGVLVESHPTSAEVLAASGDVHNISGDLAEAVGLYKRTVAIDPGNYEVWRQLLLNMRELRDFESLRHYAQSCLEVFPTAIDARLLYVDSLIEGNEKEEALKQLKDIEFVTSQDSPWFDDYERLMQRVQ